MDNEIKLMFYLLQIALQLFCISIGIYLLTRKEKNGLQWLGIFFVAGFSFQFIRRILAIIWLYELPFPEIRTVTLIIVPTCVSICYAFAMFLTLRYVKNQRKKLKKSEENLKELKRLTKRLE